MSFDRLHPSMQHHVVNTLGWSSLRALQAAAIDPVLEGRHSLLLAPTAGGKTEAASFPVLSAIASERRRPLSTLYLCPLRALLNDLHPRLERYGAWVGARVGLWHGDVGPAERQRLIADPPDVLLTTPESLEAMFLSTRVNAHLFLGSVRTVVIDEIHAFAGDDRGWHLLALLARLQHLTDAEIQRIGLSATVGNPGGLLAWMTRSCTETGVVVAPPVEAPTEPEVSIDHVGTLENAARVIAGLHQGEKRLAFVDSRARAELLTHELRSLGTDTFVTHASLGRDERLRAETAFAEASNCVIVATSALELGIDVGDLDRVIQIDAPSTVASMLQRLGRSGRRAGTTRNLLMLATSDEALQLGCGIGRLWRDGWVEPIEPPALPAHLLAHQVLALVLQEGALGSRTWPEWLGSPLVLGEDVELMSDAVIEHLTSTGYLSVDEGMWTIGPTAEEEMGRKHFLELTSVFTSPPIYTVLVGRREIGQVHDLSIWAAFQTKEGPATLLLGGRGWRIIEVDWRRRRVHVEVSEQRGRTSYRGFGRPLGYEFAQAVGRVLAGAEPGVTLSKRASTALDRTREHAQLIDPATATTLRSDLDGKVTWWTCAGLQANVELAARLGELAAGPHLVDSLSIRLAREEDPATVYEAAVATTPVNEVLDATDEMAESLKFASAIPAWLADAITLARFSDPDAVAATLDRPVTRRCG